MVRRAPIRCTNKDIRSRERMSLTFSRARNACRAHRLKSDFWNIVATIGGIFSTWNAASVIGFRFCVIFETLSHWMQRVLFGFLLNFDIADFWIHCCRFFIRSVDWTRKMQDTDENTAAGKFHYSDLHTTCYDCGLYYDIFQRRALCDKVTISKGWLWWPKIRRDHRLTLRLPQYPREQQQSMLWTMSRPWRRTPVRYRQLETLRCRFSGPDTGYCRLTEVELCLYSQECWPCYQGRWDSETWSRTARCQVSYITISGVSTKWDH